MPKFRVGILELPDKKTAIGWIRESLHRLKDGERFPIWEAYIIRKLYARFADSPPSHFIVSRLHAPGNAPAICPVDYAEGLRPVRRKVISYTVLFSAKDEGDDALDAAIDEFRREYRQRTLGRSQHPVCTSCHGVNNLQVHHAPPYTSKWIKNEWKNRGGDCSTVHPGSLVLRGLGAFRQFHDRHAEYQILCEACHIRIERGLRKQFAGDSPV